MRFSHRQVVLKLLFIAIPCGLLVLGIYATMHALRMSFECQANLRTLYRALELYEMERGSLPKLAFYPDEPTEDTDSLRVVLEPFGATGAAARCPCAPANLKEVGLSYIWNTRLNGRKMPKGEEREWMLVEVQALSSDVPAPHWGAYHALFSDGKVERITGPKRQLEGL